MLAFLNIRNLATVSQLEMEFAPGLNAVTGETGAGKSVIIGALQALLGERTGKTIIRHGENRCEITAEFLLPDLVSGLSQSLRQILAEAGAEPCREQRLYLRRVITATSSRAYINDSTVTLEALRAVGDLLVDIHGPHDHQSLLGPVCQMELLDGFAGLGPMRAECASYFRQSQACREQISQLENTTVDQAEREIIAYQLREIQAAELDADQEKNLHERYQAAVNARSLIENALACRQALGEADDSVLEHLRPCVSRLEENRRLGDQSASDQLARLESIVAQVEDLSQDLTAYAEEIELDDASLREIELRLEEIQRLRRKYGGTIDAVLDRAAELTVRLEASEKRDERLQELGLEQDRLCGLYRECCRELSSRRRKAALELASKVQEKLQWLGFENCRFSIETIPATPGIRGEDRVEFNFAPNPGEGIRPLRKIVSSGEMARIMLGIKAVFSAVDQIPVLVFDEVDANIGGRTANQVAGELARIADHHQVFCITHLPQIASAASTHYRVDKVVADGRTVTRMELLESDHRLQEIVRMMGGDEDSEIARKHAKIMIED